MGPPPVRAGLVALLLPVVLTLTSCGDDGDAGGAADGSTRDAAAGLSFFKATEQACDEYARTLGHPRVPHRWFSDAVVVRELSDGVWWLRDGAHRNLVIDLGARTVAPAEGERLPERYRLGCPGSLFVTTPAPTTGEG